jgi:hypothetical protein
MSRLAPSMRAIVSAISPTTSTLKRERLRPVVVPAPALSTEFRSTRLVRHAGTMAKASVVSVAMPSANAKMRQLRVTAIAPRPGTSRVM